ncbi:MULTISPECIES: TolC family protein [Comamonadaceae]|uniref:Outer membrane efflux protein n=1 Tax=Alicycliphilus denitrificans (strain DSM 14773 / CIP 107495 / K601) TaxID=596154 RepID=F4GGD9_ALIDK|nr:MULTISPECIES: TolC family protein [Comamonadaceae]ABM41688.1 outer membrane efflux protein [Acidovorax sp. JS42]AEB85093.1 outer membrane efflux protein [Alicycliphilus denitrificans K601]GAO24095.1 outer membrane efflux protein [Alicycliphilus sp. B1]
MMPMRNRLSLGVVVVSLALSSMVHAQEAKLGSSVEGLLQAARDRNPEIASMRFDADAAAERVAPAGALPDPKIRTELRDITRMGEQNPTLLPGRVGSTRYVLMQDFPWMGKRGLKREVAESQAQAARSRAAGAWVELAAKIKTTYAELYYLDQNERLSREILDLMARLEKVAQVRYAGGLAAQQDVIRAQVEQSTMRNELIALDAERRQLQSKLNALVGRPTSEILAAPEQIRALPSPEQVSFAALEGRARMNNPLLRTEESQIRAAEKNRELTYKNRYPDFNVGISPIQYRGSIKEWELMVELNIPLQQDSRRAQERESEAMLAAARSRQEVVTNQVLADLYANVAGFESARRSLALTTESLLPQSELTFRSALAGYQTGKVDFATLLDAQRQIRQSKLNQIKAGVEAQKRLTEIERIVGEEQ